LTRGTLTRPWCAAEIVTAFKRGKQVTAVLTPSFTAPNEEQLAAVDTYLDVGGAELLVQHGISMVDVQGSFVQLMAAQGCSHLQVEREPTTTAHFQDLVHRLLQNDVKSSPPMDAARPGCFVISADPCDPEATAAACILVHSMQEVARTITKEGVCFLSDCMGMGTVGHCLAVATARALVVILSMETLSSVHQLEILAHAMGLNEQGQGPVTISANIFGFSFPGTTYYSQVLPQIWPEVSEAQARRIRSFFHTISCPYWTHASDQVLQAQTEAITRRISSGWTPVAKRAIGAPEGLVLGDQQQSADAAIPPTMLRAKPSAAEDGISHKCTHQEWV